MFYWVFDGVDERPGWDRPGDPRTEQRTTRFRSWRGGARWHAACDLVVPVGSVIRAVCDGTVTDFSPFYEGTWELCVLHEHPGYEPFIARYGEVASPDAGGLSMAAGTRVRGGDTIARVGRLDSGGHMLHFELYAGSRRWPSLSLPRNRGSATGPGDYTVDQRLEIMNGGWHPDFQRRSDLADPAAFLTALKRGVPPPAPTPFASVVLSERTEITFSEDEVEPVIGRRPDEPGHAGAARRCGPSLGGTRTLSTQRLPSWRETYLGVCDEEHADAVAAPWAGRHGPSL